LTFDAELNDGWSFLFVQLAIALALAAKGVVSARGISGCVLETGLRRHL
jgi:hypothetical protein